MDHVNSLAVARIAIGTGMLLAPEPSLKVGLLDPTARQAPYLARMFGSREIAIGALTLLAAPAQQVTLIKVGVAIDAADAVAGYLGIRSKGLSTPAGAALTGVAVVAVVSGLAGLRQRGAL
ncbi:hypothetical protein G7072_17000 [Nocardioides sp. HDW12B]|uniref:hypothetical protein n=1 Tax=Nocardioides sp. HDW12B TaxID=2714939 RepID=UPI001407D951|nr:hypothetical protein [Nocardioides sp. HDW12B]QIK67815.1 hypothetical protein G7072_17000 [Nocardioides sp. HDW12B]